MSESPRVAKIGHLDESTFAAYQYIIWFEISVHYVTAVQVAARLQNLFRDESDL